MSSEDRESEEARGAEERRSGPPRPGPAGPRPASPRPDPAGGSAPGAEAGAAEQRGRTGAAAASHADSGGAADGPQQADSAPVLTGRQRLAAGLWPPRVNRNQLVAAVLLGVLGLGLAIQVRSTSEDSSLRGARQEDLVRILGELDQRNDRLESEKSRLEGQKSELENSSDQAEEARKQTRERARQLGVLAGTVAAEGPGIRLTITDRVGAVEADRLLDAIQELRAAGAEALQINEVRVVAGTYFAEADSGVRIDGRKVSPPYRFEVIGRPQDLEPALNIPGGVVQTLENEQAGVSIERSEKIVVDALRSEERPDYAQSSSR